MLEVFMNKNAVICSALLITACTPSREAIETEYNSLSCDQLKNEYRQVLKNKVEAFNQRMKDNDINPLVTATLGVLAKESVNSADSYLGNSLSEKEADDRLDVLRNALRKNMCSKSKCTTCKGDNQ